MKKPKNHSKQNTIYTSLRKSTSTSRNIPIVEKIPYGKVARGSFTATDKVLWLRTHQAFLRWQKTPQFERWRNRQFMEQGGTCYYCDEPLNGTKNSIDHIVPKSKRGSNSPYNLVIACWKCNKDKRAKLLTTKEREDLRKKNKAKSRSYEQLKIDYPSEEDIALDLRERFRED